MPTKAYLILRSARRARLEGRKLLRRPRNSDSGVTLAVAGTMLLVFSWIAAALAAEPPPGASSCSGCHAAAAGVETPVPRLVGRPAADLVAAMRDYRSGTRPGTVMDRIAKGFSDPEVAAIAAWYAGHKE